jgi:[acyl-carrier-protein] S-malonyltransferase
MAVVATAGQDKGTLVAANFNSPGQIVLSGTADAVGAAAEIARERGAKRVIPLAVSGAFHSPLMGPAAEKLTAELAATEIKDPAVPVVSNVAAKYVQTADEIRDLLTLQLTSSVLWEDSMRFMISEGMTEATEVGPGRVLAGLLAKTDRSVAVRNIGALTDLE